MSHTADNGMNSTLTLAGLKLSGEIDLFTLAVTKHLTSSDFALMQRWLLELRLQNSFCDSLLFLFACNFLTPKSVFRLKFVQTCPIPAADFFDLQEAERERVCFKIAIIDNWKYGMGWQLHRWGKSSPSECPLAVESLLHKAGVYFLCGLECYFIHAPCGDLAWEDPYYVRTSRMRTACEPVDSYFMTWWEGFHSHTHLDTSAQHLASFTVDFKDG